MGEIGLSTPPLLGTTWYHLVPLQIGEVVLVLQRHLLYVSCSTVPGTT